ncbi:MAG: hypothetical protein HQM04_02610 [Magnetococcales bacterium]|nr:hypothetical protein [Magnetococcales bacterium]
MILSFAFIFCLYLLPLSFAFIFCLYLLPLSFAFGALFTLSRRGFCVGAARLIDARCADWRGFLRQSAHPPNGFCPQATQYLNVKSRAPPSQGVPLRGTNLGALRRFGCAKSASVKARHYKQGSALHPPGAMIAPGPRNRFSFIFSCLVI